MPASSPPPPTGTTIASHVGRLLEDLERHRALAGDHVRVVERMDERQAFARGDRLGLGARFGQVGAVQHDRRAELAAVGHLDQRGELRHDDGHRNAEQRAVIGDALRVVAGRRGDHAALALRRRQLQQRVARAALLEAAGALQVVELAVDVRAGQLRQRDRLDARRLVDAAARCARAPPRCRRASPAPRRREVDARHANGSATPGFAAVEHAAELALDARRAPRRRRLRSAARSPASCSTRARGRSRPAYSTRRPSMSDDVARAGKLRASPQLARSARACSPSAHAMLSSGVDSASGSASSTRRRIGVARDRISSRRAPA